VITHQIYLKDSSTLLSQRIKFSTMSFGGVDVLGTLTEKLKQMFNESQNHYESFIKIKELYKKEEMSEREFFDKIVNYVITISAANFLAIRVILELKSAMDKGTSIKDATGGIASPSTSPQAGFGIGGFVGTGGTVGLGSQYPIPTPQQQEPKFKPVSIQVERPIRQIREATTTTITKNCIVCGRKIPADAKFCRKCGNSQQQK
jgi:ribosomal protein L40E